MKRLQKKIFIAIFFVLIAFFFSKEVFAAELHIFPESGTYKVGQIFETSVYVSSTSQSINAVSGTLSFPADRLQVVSLSKIGTIIDFWAQEPSFSNSSGLISIEGVLLEPGFVGSKGLVLKVSFRVTEQGKGKVYFSSSSVLANDGAGTNVLNNVGQALFTLGPSAPVSSTPVLVPNDVPFAPVIHSSTHPDSTKWYPKRVAELDFDIPDNVTAISKKIDQIPTTNPGENSEEVVNVYKSNELSDGVWYFHLRLKNKYGWGDVSHFRIGVDTSKPEYFNIEEIKDTSNKTGKLNLLIKAEDKYSGIEGFQVQIDATKSFFWKVSPDNLYITEPLTEGSHIALIKAFDNAGNYSIDSIDFSIDNPRSLKLDNGLLLKIVYPMFFVFLLLILVFWYIRKRRILNKKVDNTEVIIARSFDILNKDIEVLKSLNTGKNKNNNGILLSQHEKDLEDAEGLIEKRVGDLKD
jgi:hypothetical protein